MKLKNIGTKIISIGNVVLMPEDTAEVNETLTPAIRALVDRQHLEILEDFHAEEAAPADVSEPDSDKESDAGEPAEPVEEAPRKTRGRKSAKSETE